MLLMFEAKKKINLQVFKKKVCFAFVIMWCLTYHFNGSDKHNNLFENRFQKHSSLKNLPHMRRSAVKLRTKTEKKREVKLES